MAKQTGASAERIEAILRKLTVDIGVRLAGSPGEEEAAAYVKDQLERSGNSVTIERFPVRERRVDDGHACRGDEHGRARPFTG